MALLDDVRTCLHISTTKMDVDIQVWINAAIADMRRCGVKERLLDQENMDPLALSGVVCFTKAHFGFDNNEASFFLKSYEAILAALLNSSKNEYLDPEDEQDDDGSGDDGSDDGGEGSDDGGEGDGTDPDPAPDTDPDTDPDGGDNG